MDETQLPWAQTEAHRAAGRIEPPLTAPGPDQVADALNRLDRHETAALLTLLSLERIGDVMQWYRDVSRVGAKVADRDVTRGDWDTVAGARPDLQILLERLRYRLRSALNRMESLEPLDERAKQMRVRSPRPRWSVAAVDTGRRGLALHLAADPAARVDPPDTAQPVRKNVTYGTAMAVDAGCR